jgi:murein DD-endopeptidase MepM/ murein hydrolase activator NlpD
MVKPHRWLLLCLSLLLLAGAVPPPHPGTAAGIYVLDTRSGKTLVLLLPSLELAVQSSTGETRLGLAALSARFLPNGQIAFVDENLALRRFGPRGAVDWLPPGSANAPLFVSPDGQKLAYLKPIDLLPGDNEPAANGVAVLDLATGAERLLLRVPDVTVRLYGWLGDKLLVEVPNWSPATLAPAPRMVLGLLNTDGPQAAPLALAALPSLLPGAYYPQTSLDQSYLAYQSDQGLVVASLATGRYGFLGQASDPQWTDAGLSAVLNGQRAKLAVSDAALSQFSPTTGDVALPVTAAMSAPSPNIPARPGAVLLYRPVKSSTPVSAYMDLDYNIGSISDWTGWTGTQWAWGHAYDQHKGTDYAGHLSDPVYASAPGTVDKVVIDCVNTYPGGPGSFGSYVRIDHGPQSDGFNYKTLYGHLKCDGVYANVGDVILTLPATLGAMGNTGWSTGVHTHLQVYRDGITIDPYSSNIISDSPPLSTVGNLDGIVRDADGQPASGVTVKIFSGGLYQTAMTGADGRYHFSAVRVGAASPTAVRGVRWGEAGVNIVAAQTVSAPDIILDQCGGTTTGADACPAVNYDAAAFLADVTVPDSGVVLPAQSLTKTWRLSNIGSSNWGAGYQLVFVGGTALAGAPPAVNMPPSGPNSTVDVSAAFTTPAGPGVNRAYWRLRSPSGAYFGPLLWVELNTQPAGAGLTAFTATPPSPSGANPVHLYSRADGVANFRAQLVLIDGIVVTETTALELNYDWQTTGLDTVEHSLVVEAADQTDLNWAHPQRRGINYALQGPPGLETPIDRDAQDAGSTQQPAASGTAPSCSVQTLPGISGTSPFTVTWTGSGSLYSLQFMDSGRGLWRDWLRGVASTSASFSGQLGHQYAYRCRAAAVDGSQGSYPDTADSSTLVGAQTSPADLSVANLTSVPNPSGGVLALVTIRNNSANGTQRGFFVDLYEDYLPSGVGDFTGSVQTWPVAPMAANSTITLSAMVSQASGQHTAVLFAQVDSTGVVTETDESNNIWSSGTGACVVAPDGFEIDSTPSVAKLLASGASQGHSFGGPGDRDWMLLDAQPGHYYQFSTSNLAPGVDTRLTIYGPDGVTALISNDDADGTTLASQLSWTPPVPGPYYLVADDWNPGFGGCGSSYTVGAQDQGPGFVTFLNFLAR